MTWEKGTYLSIARRAEKLKALRNANLDLQLRYFGRILPDKKYMKEGPSQYPENILEVSGGPDYDSDFEEKYQELTFDAIKNDRFIQSVPPKVLKKKENINDNANSKPMSSV